MAEAEDHAVEAPPRRRWLRRIGWALAALALLAALVPALIDSDPGRRFVAERLAATPFANGMRVRVGRIDGSLFGAMVLRDVSVEDLKGEFLHAPEVRIDWRPLAYVHGLIDVRSAEAALVTLRRRPEFRPSANPDAPLLPDLDITLGSLKVGRLVIEPAVTGERRLATIAGSARIAAGRAQVSLDAGTMADGARGGDDRIVLRLDAVPAANRLALDATLDAPAGGVIAALAGLSQPLVIGAHGKGTWQDWQGRIDADLGGEELARLALTGRQGTFTVKGPARLARLTTGAAAGLLGPSTALDLTAALDQRRARISGTVRSDALSLAPQGTVDLGDSSFSALRLPFVVARPDVLAPKLAGAGLGGTVTLDGAFAAPQIAYAVRASRLTIDQIGLEQVSASGTARFVGKGMVIPVAARVTRMTGLDAVAGGALANVRLDGDLALSGSRLVSDNLRLRADRIDATAILLADMGRGLYTGALDGRIDRFRVESVGLFQVRADMDLASGRAGLTLGGKISARSTRLDNPQVASFVGGQALGSASVHYGADGVFRFSQLRLEAPLLRVTGGQGSYAPGGQLAITAQAVSRQYGPLALRLAGTLDSPRAVVMAERPDMGIGLASLTATVNAVRGGYRLDARGDTDYGPLTADVTLTTGDGTRLAINSADLGGIGFSGTLASTPAGPWTGQLLAQGRGLGAVVRLDAAGRDQQALVNLRARNTTLPGPAALAIGSAIVDARIVLGTSPHVIADAQLAQTRISGFDLAAARVQVDYRDGRGTAKALVEGTSGVPFRLAANAQLAPDLWRVALQGRSRGVDFHTVSPARVVPHRDAYELLPTRVAFGSGSMLLAGTYGAGLTVKSRMENVDIALFNAFLPDYGVGGQATGSVDFTQATPQAFPRADARLSIAGFTRTTAALVSKPIDVTMIGKLLPDGGEAHAVFRERGAVIGRLAATLRPLGSGAGTWWARLREAPLGGGIRYNGPAETLVSLTGVSDQQLSGPIGVAADFSCRLSDPCLAGLIRGNALTYDNQTYGTHLTQLALSGRFDGNRLLIESLTARAGPGTVAAKGTLSLAAASGWPMDLAFTLDNARLARSDTLGGRATGTVRLTKAAGDVALLAGEIRLPETRFRFVRESATLVPALDGVRFRETAGPARITGNEPARAGPGLFDRIRLDLTMIAPDQLHITGMGLESEWKARFHVTGTSAAPLMAGQVELVRGTLGFAGRSFELTEGKVDFTGGRSTDAVVSLAATDDIEGTEVTINAKGRAFNPQITFSSVPGLPQDEILSRILFGSSIANIDALQAVQLAASLNTLRASGGGLGPLGRLQSATGVDRLRILGADQTTGRGTAVAAGQYITNDIYVELITDARGFTATQIEVGLARWLSLIGATGGSGESSASLKVRKDY